MREKVTVPAIQARKGGPKIKMVIAYDAPSARIADRAGADMILVGDTLAVMDWDSHRYLECYFAIPMMGAVLQTVNIRLSPEQILYTLNHARANVILCHTDGNPKGVYFSHRQLVLHTLAALGSLASPAGQQCIHYGDVYMPITPMFHVHAWGVPYLATAMGLKQVYPGRYLPDTLLSLIKQEKVTFSHCVPTLLHMILTHPAARNVDLSGWTVIIGGSALPKGLAKLAMDKGIDIFGGYGMSETCPVLSLAQLKPSMTELDADTEIAYRTKAGLPIQLVELRIVDEQMQDVPHGGTTSGEVVVRAPWLTQGYLNDPTNSEELWRGSYLHTRDIGTIDPEGYLLITDRIKDVIKSGGEWLSSLTIEDIIDRVEAGERGHRHGAPPPEACQSMG
jgi:acyl-CoA synthetase (AMP-forming)/AMP-acid ligase II